MYSIEEILEATNILLNKKSSTQKLENEVTINEFEKPIKKKLSIDEKKQFYQEINKLFNLFIQSTAKSIVKNN